MKYAAIVIGVVVALAGRLDAYPQFQLSRDTACASCHISPAGGGILNENGLNVADTMSTYGTAPDPFYGRYELPSWFLLSGDIRGAGGYVYQQKSNGAFFPMQAEVDVAARGHGFTAYATVGAQAGDTSRPWTFALFREHYLMWQSNPDQVEGMYIRAGRFMPVYGLRFAEHNFFVRRYGQTPLYGETYGAAVEYIQKAWEIHATVFAADPLQDPIERGNGVAVYAEARFGNTQVGVESRYANSPQDERIAGGVTAKQWLPSANVLLEAEVQAIRQSFDAGGNRVQVVSQLLGTWFFHDGWMLDVGASQFDSDTSIAKTDMEAFDVNVHWFTTSHLELLLTNRVQTLQLGAGGRTAGYSLLQLHYRI